MVCVLFVLLDCVVWLLCVVVLSGVWCVLVVLGRCSLFVGGSLWFVVWGVLFVVYVLCVACLLFVVCCTRLVCWLLCVCGV